MRRNGGVKVRRNVPVVRQRKFKVVLGAVPGVRDQEAGAALVANRQLQIGAVEHRNRTQLKARVPDLSDLLLAILDHFATHHAPGVRPRQTGGKGPVVENGIAVLTALLHQVSGAAALASYQLVVTVPDVGVFGVQVSPAFWPFQDHLVIIIVHVAQRIDGTDRLGLALRLLLVKLHLVRFQTAVTLLNIHVAGKYGIFRIVTLRVIGVNSDGQLVRFALYQRTVIAWDAQQTLRGEIGCQPLLTVQG